MDLTRPLVEWFYPGKNSWEIILMTIEVRRLGHLVLYGCLAILGVRIILEEFQLGRLRSSGWALVIVLLLATADEGHQALSLKRSGRLSDIGLDVAGSAASLILYWWFKHVRMLWQTENR